MRFTKEQLEPLFDVPSKQAAKKLGISNNHLKRMCRRIGIERWPHRKIRSLKRLKERVSGSTVQTIEEEIARLKHEPNSDISDNIRGAITMTYKHPNKADIKIESYDSSYDESIDTVDELSDECWMQCLSVFLQDPQEILDDKQIEAPDTPKQATGCILSQMFVQNKPPPVCGAVPNLPLLSTPVKRLGS